jgi:hypothetical protein
MSTADDPDGDMPIDLQKRSWTLQDTSFLTRVPVKSIRNWVARGILRVGTKDRLTGRWYFSLEDCVRLSVLADLCTRDGIDISPSKVVRIADYTLAAALKGRDRATIPPVTRPNINVVVAWSEAGEMQIGTADITQPGNFYPPQNTGEYEPLRRTILTIPASSLLTDLVLRTGDLAAVNRKVEAPWHV